MTPFAPAALLAMLLTFYPIVSVANLQIARRDRPEYFAGGTLFGTTGEKLRLPDGRVFDLIFDASNPDPARRRWQVIAASGAGDSGGLFPLEAGPFTPIDESAWPAPHAVPVFVPLVASAYASLGDADGLFGQASSTLVAASSSAALQSVFSDTINRAEDRVDSSRNNLTAADPSDVIVASGGQVPAIASREDEYGVDVPDEPVAPEGSRRRPWSDVVDVAIPRDEEESS